MSRLAAGRVFRATVTTLQNLKPQKCLYPCSPQTMCKDKLLSSSAMAAPRLPRLPVPPLKQTLDKYLRTVQPLMTADEYRRTENLVVEFGAAGGIGQKLQGFLEQKARQTESWLADWWLNTAYLSYRSPVVVYSSPGIVLPRQPVQSLDEQIRCAAKVILGALDYKHMVDNNLLPQEMMGKALLDMSQHGMIFGTCRIPGVTRDELVFAPHGLECPRHIVVIHNNNFFKASVYDGAGNPLSEGDLIQALSDVVQKGSDVAMPVGILTSENRNVWGNVYRELRKSAMNNQVLAEVQKSLFVVSLDGPNKPSKHNHQTVSAAQMIHGCGSDVNSGNRWFDKTVQFIIGTSGEIGLCYEHSPAEGPPIANISDHVVDFLTGVRASKVPASRASKPAAAPEILQFEITGDVRSAIDSAKKNMDILVRDLDMACFTFEPYGKSFIKTQKLSPDSYIQVALQLAFYRIHKELGATYESASTRQYLHGRTETIRSATTEALEFCKAISSHKMPSDEKKLFLEKAVSAHKAYVNDAVRGFGVDRHLLGLKLIAVENGLEIPEFYLDASYTRSSHFRISTSQVAARHGSFMCYGPLVPDGYGCCYNPRDNDMLFGISAFNSCAETSASHFQRSLHDSLVDMHNTLLAAQKAKL